MESSGFAALTDPEDPRFHALLALYEAAIPERERKSRDSVRAMLSSPSHRAVVAIQGGSVTGFFLLYLGKRIALLEYLATEERLRGQGLGRNLYQAVKAEAGARPLIIEVESDREQSEDRALRARRIGFYRRFGCRRVAGVDFILPLAGLGGPPMLDLLVDNVPEDGIQASVFADWLTEIYCGVYGCAPDDPRLEAMIDALPSALLLD